jgi:arginine deiminase
MTVHVTSEIGRLRSVVVHTPGNELLGVTPTTREAFLYDDLPDADQARTEHRRFTAILERFCRVYEVRDLLAQVLENREVRELLVSETMDIVPERAARPRDRGAAPARAGDHAHRGKVETPGPLART